MPHYNKTKAKLLEQGPRLSVYFGPPTSLRQILFPYGGNELPDLKAEALIDTGASHTIISSGLLEHLQLNPVGSARVFTAGQELASAIYGVMLTIPQGQLTFHMQLQVCEVELPGDNSIDCLIGRDVLSKAMFTYNGSADSYNISF